MVARFAHNAHPHGLHSRSGSVGIRRHVYYLEGLGEPADSGWDVNGSGGD